MPEYKNREDLKDIIKTNILSGKKQVSIVTPWLTLNRGWESAKDLLLLVQTLYSPTDIEEMRKTLEGRGIRDVQLRCSEIKADGRTMVVKLKYIPLKEEK